MKRIKRVKQPEPTMKYEETKSGMGVIRINTDTYISFGTATGDDIKYVNIRYPTGGKLFPIALMKLPSHATKAIGVKNIKLIRELIRERLLEDGTLPRKKVGEIGDIINSEGKS